jgi:hypothetical protein
VDGDPTALDITTLVIALIGLAAALLSLGWQVASWLLSGPRVRVGISHAIMTMTDGSVGPRCIAVEARNVGRAEASLVSWAISFPDGGTIVPAMSPGTPWWGPSLPHPLGGGHSATWLVDFDSFVKARAQAGFGEVDIRAVVSLGSGKKIVSRSTIKV